MDKKTQAILNEIAGQRNGALDTVASLMGEIAERDAIIADLRAQLAKAKKRQPKNDDTQ